MPTSPAFTLTGTIEDLSGAADQGYALITLVNYSGIPRISGTSIVAAPQYKAQCNGSGVFSATIWGNDQITPANTYYTVQLVSASGPQGIPQSYSLTGSGTSDLSALLPLNTPPTPGIPTIPNIQPYAPITHQFLTGLSSTGFFSGAQPAFTDISGVASAAQLPTPTATTLGGVKSLAAVSHQYLTQIGTDGSVSRAQPSLSDLSDTPAQNLVVASPNGSSGALTPRALVGADLPTPAVSTLGGVKSLAAVSHKYLTQIGTDGSVSQAQPQVADLSDGTTGTGTVVLSSSPTITTPTISSGGAAFSGSSSGTTTVKASATASGTLTLPAATDTVVARATTDTLSNKTVAAGGLPFNGSTSGSTTLQPSATASGTLTMPSATDTLVARATTDTLSNKTMTGASSGNSVTLLNIQAAKSAITGNSSAQTMYTYTMPANTMGINKAIRIRAGWTHNSGTASVAYGLSFGGTSMAAPGASTTGPLGVETIIWNNGATNAQQGFNFPLGLTGYLGATTAAAIDTTAAVTITLTFNVANTDQVTPQFFMVELIQ